MPKIEINEELCKGCGLCKAFCPRQVIELATYLNNKGFHPATPAYPDKCSGCKICALMCPDVAITVYK